MAFYAKIEDLINSVNNTEISYRNLHTTSKIEVNGVILTIPYDSIIRKYRSYFTPSVMETKFIDNEKLKYNYKPKSLSYDLYGTTELWSALMELNNMVSIIDFKVDDEILIYEPRGFKEILNEVMIIEGIIQ